MSDGTRSRSHRLRALICAVCLPCCSTALLHLGTAPRLWPTGVGRNQPCVHRRRHVHTRCCAREDEARTPQGFGFGTEDENTSSGEETGTVTTIAPKAAEGNDSDFSVSTILKQLESIQQGTPKNIVVLGTRHCSFLHQQIIELLSYALVLSTPTRDNHIYTSGATGTHAAAIRGALRADNQDLLTVILPQTVQKQPREIRELLGQVTQVIELGHNQLPLDAASRICNSELLAKGDQLIVFAFHDSKTLRETIEEAKAMSLLVTVLFLD